MYTYIEYEDNYIYIYINISFMYILTSLFYVHLNSFYLAHIYVDLILFITNVICYILSNINKHFLLLLLLINKSVNQICNSSLPMLFRDISSALPDRAKSLETYLIPY